MRLAVGISFLAALELEIHSLDDDDDHDGKRRS